LSRMTGQNPFLHACCGATLCCDTGLVAFKRRHLRLHDTL
jgi:hypothetical protein